MEKFINKLVEVEKRISKERGDFNFFGIFKRIDLDNAWDILVSASWFSDQKKKHREDLVYIIKNIKEDFDDEDLRFLTTVVLVSSEDRIIKLLNKLINTQHNLVEFKDTKVGNINFKHFYVITSIMRKTDTKKNNQ